MNPLVAGSNPAGPTAHVRDAHAPPSRLGSCLTKSILFATNGAKPSQDAGRLLRQTADPRLVKITVNVCDSVEFAFPQEPWKFGGERKPRPQPAEVAAAEVDNFQRNIFEADHYLGSGIPAEQILEKVREGGCELAVLGAGSTKWVDNFLLGSTSTRVLHGSPTSVLIVHHFEDASGPVRLLVTTDGSSDAELAVGEVIGLADPAKATVKVVSIADVVPRIPRLVPETLSPDEVGQYLHAAARRVADIAAGRLQEAGFDVQTEIRTGEPIKELLKLAGKADLVVCGSQGMGGVGRLLLGSVSEQLARLAPATLVCRRA